VSADFGDAVPFVQWGENGSAVSGFPARGDAFAFVQGGWVGPTPRTGGLPYLGPRTDGRQPFIMMGQDRRDARPSRDELTIRPRRVQSPRTQSTTQVPSSARFFLVLIRMI
jgi:hypothetical protein